MEIYVKMLSDEPKKLIIIKRGEIMKNFSVISIILLIVGLVFYHYYSERYVAL